MHLLLKLKRGDCLRVLGFVPHNNPILRHRLLSMGLTRGTEFSVTRIAPLGDPIEVSVRQYVLSLRISELATMKLEKIASSTTKDV